MFEQRLQPVKESCSMIIHCKAFSERVEYTTTLENNQSMYTYPDRCVTVVIAR